MSLAYRIKEARHNRHYTQKELAGLMHVKPTTISGWELGRNEPSLGTLRELARVLGSSFSYLVGSDGDENKKDLAKDPHALDAFSFNGKPIKPQYRAALEAMLKSDPDYKDKQSDK